MRRPASLFTSVPLRGFDPAAGTRCLQRTFTCSPQPHFSVPQLSFNALPRLPARQVSGPYPLYRSRETHDQIKITFHLHHGRWPLTAQPTTFTRSSTLFHLLGGPIRNFQLDPPLLESRGPSFSIPRHPTHSGEKEVHMFPVMSIKHVSHLACERSTVLRKFQAALDLALNRGGGHEYLIPGESRYVTPLRVGYGYRAILAGSIYHVEIKEVFKAILFHLHGMKKEWTASQGNAREVLPRRVNQGINAARTR